MKNYTFRLFKGSKNDPIYKGTDEELTKSRREILNLKRSLRKDKKIKYKITMLDGEKEPLLFIEKLLRFFKRS